MAHSVACSSLVSPKRYDVFISFRGEDIRTGFTSHLHKALTNKGIETFIDYQLERGDGIWDSLCKAIENSYISVVVFSRHYASSTWCLKELVKIMECRKHLGLLVIPVFYNTDPSQVRYQRETYQEAFSEQERNLRNRNDESEERRWRAALAEATDLSGFDSQSRDESLLIKDIVKDVLQKLLEFGYSNTTKRLVGIEETRKHVELLLKNAQRIGIWGIGGIGKTTIAKVVFTILTPHYDSVCFLENITEESKYGELAYLRGKLLEQLKQINPIGKVVGTKLTTRSLKKALIVLDGVDTLEQLEYLCEESKVLDDLPEDSRVIITTRNRCLLTNKVDEIYEVKALSPEESLKLFSLRAFREIHPKEGYEELSKRAVEYAGGIPFALNALGSYLSSSRSLDKDFWESTMRKLENSPNVEIQEVLRY
ncbi:TMV resistance protein N [Arachis ipaensis]|uniref:TMV resistance protein N n=1 Tax=Arachis ipaensis TaxID=130454 RepID=UPI0007AF3C73|nr:TMV resistance protein N [Arachis ipaensis]XP_016173979.1 TMV resistance protein N [Arachis ipaensis]XP_020967129.1 TMV resistance protein N [Arachis ipaensis]XP_020967130.1 TMV resistance protein N [Arachis ipaensis]XP_020967131.1 TMV resistance protein N [Arachis ipaensis]